MMVEKRILRFGLCALAGLSGLAFSGCVAPEETGTAPSAIQPASEGPTPFQKELYLLKQRLGHSDALEPAIVELVGRYGFPVPGDEDRGTEVPDPGGPVAAKVAAGYQYLKVKSASGSIVTTTYKSVTLKNGEHMTLSTSGSTDATDPMIVVYNLSGSGDSRTVTLQSVGFDEVGTVDAAATAVNTTGGDKTFYYAVLAESYATRGQTDLKRRIVNVVTGTVTDVAYQDMPVGGRVYFKNTQTANPSPNCYGPQESRLKVKLVPAAGDEGNVQALGINFNAKAGLWARSYGETVSTLGTFIPSGNPNFVAVFRTASTEEPEIGPSQFIMYQEDEFACIQ